MAKNAVAKSKGQEVVGMDFESLAGRGMEGTTQDSFAIPFIKVLQKTSAQVDEASGAIIKGAKPGMFYETISKKMFDGKKGIDLICCAYKRVFLRWGPTVGSGFKGELSPEAVARMRNDGLIKDNDGALYVPMDDGSYNEKKCDRVVDVRNHYILFLGDGEEEPIQALLSIGSTQIKKSKNLMSALANKKKTGSSGNRYTPPTFATIIHATSAPESNVQGSWFGINFDLKSDVSEKSPLIQTAVDYNVTIAKDLAKVDYNSLDADGDKKGGF